MKYSKKAVSKAGKVLISKKISDFLQKEAIKILTAFRIIHVSPMFNFRILLENKIKKLFKKGDFLISQRLKRKPSIIKKLKLNKHMSLDTMQDIAGLRVVLNNKDDVYKLRNEIFKSHRHRSFKSVLKKEYDYIKNPKESGYRSLHLVYSYEKNVKISEKCRIEIQLRTKIQHAWATAIEVLSVYLGQPLKQSFGNEEYLNLFKKISKGFQLLEEGKEDQLLFTQLKKEINEIKLKEMLDGFRLVTKFNDKKIFKKENGYWLIILNRKEKKVEVQGFSKRKLKDANKQYSDLEKEEDLDVVLVAVNEIKKLRNNYPNYFLDTVEFLGLLDKF